MKHKFPTLKSLLEGPPDFGDREMPAMTHKINSYSLDTINREFDVVKKFTLDKEFWVLIKKNRNFAVVGFLNSRNSAYDDPGFEIVCHLDFKSDLELSFFNEIDVSAKNALQVDGVEVYDAIKMRGIGSQFYFALAKYGFVIISDNFQYLGGKALWKKIASKADSENCAVYVINEGEPLTDEDGDLINYDGNNLDDDELWAPIDVPVNDRKKYVLFILKKN